MEFSKPVTEIIRQRFSCRTYQEQVVPAGIKDKILSYSRENSVGPFGGSVRLHIIENLELASDEQIGTYGFISGASAFLAGAIQKAEKCFVDYG